LFTGIIEETGVIKELRIKSQGAVAVIAAKTIPSESKIGDSIAVNGVCLTATKIGMDYFSCDLSMETLRRSSLNRAKQGVLVNLERPLTLNGRLGGHIVQGHVDGVGRLLDKKPSGDGFEISFNFPRELEKYLVHKGSIAVDGISLTIFSLDRDSFSVAVIPHTLDSTNLRQLQSGDPVNLEVDILGKYFERFVQLGLIHNRQAESKLTPEYLLNQGFQ
jgi:riboflavin synthase